MSASEPTAAEALRARHRATARRNAGRHRAAAARYVPDYQEKHLTFTQRCLAAEAEAKKAKAAAAKPKCACCGGTGIAGGGTGTAGMAAASVLAGVATGGMLAADMHHD